MNATHQMAPPKWSLQPPALHCIQHSSVPAHARIFASSLARCPGVRRGGAALTPTPPRSRSRCARMDASHSSRLQKRRTHEETRHGMTSASLTCARKHEKNMSKCENLPAPGLGGVCGRHERCVLHGESPVCLGVAAHVAEPCIGTEIVGRLLVPPHWVRNPLETAAAITFVSKRVVRP